MWRLKDPRFCLESSGCFVSQSPALGLSRGLGVAGALRLVGVGLGLGGDLLGLLDAALLRFPKSRGRLGVGRGVRGGGRRRRLRGPALERGGLGRLLRGALFVSTRLLGRAPLLLGFCFFFSRRHGELRRFAALLRRCLRFPTLVFSSSELDVRWFR